MSKILFFLEPIDPAQGGRPFPPTTAPTPSVAAAPKGNNKIAGIVLDSTSKQPVEFATVALYLKNGDTPVDGTTTDDKGKFDLSGIGSGEYRLIISFIGYRDKTLADLRFTKNEVKNLGNISFSQSISTLKEVEIVGTTSLIEEKVDRTVFNAEKDITSKGGDATEVLRKVPMLSVDLDGNVSLRGSSNVTVLINNKPSTIMAASVADALKQIPADMIKTVEVITSPSARYDAEGSGGIINIVTKKNTLQGLTLNVDIGTGNRSSNLGLNGSYRKGKMGFNLGGFGRMFYNPSLSTFEQNTIGSTSSFRTRQEVDAFDNGSFGHYNLGWDWDLAKNQSLSASARIGVRNFKRDQDMDISVFENQILKSNTFRNVDSKDNSGSIDFNLDYLRTFKPQREWSISTQYSRNDLVNNFDSDLFSDDEITILNSQRNINNNLNQEFTLQTDYQTPIGKQQMIEFGGKNILRMVESDYSYFLAQGNSGVYNLDLTRPSGALDYQQDVASGYLSYTLQTKNKYTFKVGGRYEHTTIDAETVENGRIDLPDYGNFVPSVNLSKNLGKSGFTLKGGYNRRIQRPGLQQLNPNFNAANPQSITVGNPELNPELTNNFELGLSGNIKKTYLNLSVFRRITDNAISQIRKPSDTLAGAVITTFENVGVQRAWGANLFGNFTILPKWTINGGIDIMYAFMEGRTTGLNGLSEVVSNDGIMINGRLMTQVTLPKGWGIQGFSFIRGPQVQLQGRQAGFGMYSLGLRKDFKNKKGSLGFGAENFLTRGIRLKTDLSSPTFTQFTDVLRLNRGFRVNFNYRIGKMTFDAPRKKAKSVENDDIKAGEDNSGGGTPNAGGGRGNRQK
jgi:outer membrane receptor protein involved in Fe transport